MAKTLLLADDSVTIQKVVNISFASEDVTLVTVDNGDDAIERAKETCPDLILADVVMPGKSGYEVCEAVKADPDLRHIPVLLLTGTFEAFDEEHAARVGAAGHVAKPFEAQTLVSRVKELLAATPPPPAAEPVVTAEPSLATASDEPVDTNADSFDFFDDDVAEVAASTPAVTPEPTSIDDADSAFAFGDAELTPMAAPAQPAEAAPLADSPFTADATPFPDRTVAILPDDPSAPDLEIAPPVVAEPVEVPPTALSADLIDGGFGDPADELLAVAASDADDSFVTVDPTGTSDETFDFSFERDPERSDAEAESGTLSVEAEDVAHATVLDPNGASGYDVSSSDLGDPLAFGATGDPLAEPVVESVAEPSAEPIADPISLPEMDDPFAAPEDPADATAFFDLDSVEDEPALVSEPIATAEMLDESASSDVAPDAFAEPESPLVADPIFDAAPPTDEAARPLPADSAAAADAVLAEITPQLREQIHDTLEKIAWESFGTITEKVIADVVDRVEKVAWEVIPQLAETLIKAEISRIKGESDD
jgi:CheY-like chemotaxis protein